MKTFQKNGKWVERSTSPNVSTCKCGYRYIKTRTGQTECIKCSVRIPKKL